MKGNIPIPELPSAEEVWIMIAVTSVRERRTKDGKPFREVSGRNHTGSIAINGPLQVLFMGMTAGVTLVNATGNLSGTPYLTIPALNGLGPGQSVTVSVQFSNPSNAKITVIPVVYTGSIN